MSTTSLTIPITKQVISALFAAVSVMLLKQITNLELNQILYFRSTFSILLLIIIAKVYNLEVYNFDKQTVNGLIKREFLSAIGGFIYFQGLKLVLVSESIILNRTFPIWTSLIQIYILRQEKFTLKLLINMVLCIIGIYLIAINKSDTNSQNIDVQSYGHMFGLFLILLASVIQAVVNILVKSINKQVDSSIITLYQRFFSLLLVSVYSITNATNYKLPSIQDTVLIFLMSSISLLSGVLQTQSFREGDLSIISNVSQIQIPFGYIIDLIVFQAKLNGEQILGNILLLCSLIPLVWKN